MHDDALRLVHLLPEPAFLLTGDGQIVAGNSAASRLTGVAAEALTGAPLTSLVAQGERVREYLRLCARSRQLVPGAISWTANGGPFPTTST